MLAVFNIGLFSFISDDQYFPLLKNNFFGVNIDKAMKDIPVYPDSELTELSAKQLRFSYIYQSIRESSDTVAQISAWYADELAKRGWETRIPSSDINAPVQYLEFEKPFIRQLRLSLMPSQDGTKTVISTDFGPKYQDDDELAQTESH
jgi:hypothetical protein